MVAITACRDDSVNDQAKKAGIKKVLYKPVDFRLLKETLDAYYYRTKTSDAAQESFIA